MKKAAIFALAVALLNSGAANGATTSDYYECESFGDVIGMAQYEVNNGQTDPRVIGSYILEMLAPLTIGQTMEVWESEEYANMLIEMKGRSPTELNQIGRKSCVDFILVK